MSFWFTEHDAYRILSESEGRPDANGRHPGHARARHVAIRKDDLNERTRLGGATKIGVAVYTAFLSDADQARAVAAAFRAPEAAALMNRVFHPAWRDWFDPGDPLKIEDVLLTPPVPVRMGIGGERSPTRPGTFMTVYFSMFPGRTRDLHIVSAFASPLRNPPSLEPARPPKRKPMHEREPVPTKRHHRG